MKKTSAMLKSEYAQKANLFIILFCLLQTGLLAQGTWTQKLKYAGVSNYGYISVGAGNKGYVGLGADSLGTYTNEFWEYDPATNTWSQKANFTGPGREKGVAFSIGSMVYV
ncbi:MAG: kelch repeat-containing protein [Chitinophagales bacterium]